MNTTTAPKAYIVGGGIAALSAAALLIRRTLLDLKPATAQVARERVAMEVPADSVAAGESVVVRTGQRIATDGLVQEGTSAIDESMLTGKSMPVEKRAGSKVIGGTLNRTGSFRFQATRVGADRATLELLADVLLEKEVVDRRMLDELLKSPSATVSAPLLAHAPQLT